jgi:hypothetical protein
VNVPKEKKNMLENKAEKCIFISYKDGVKGYKLWNLVIRKIIYSHDVIFREVNNTPKHEDKTREGEPKKIEFELENGEFDSMDEDELDEEDEPRTPTLRRSI